jgi:hypothetical protein
MVPPLIDLGLSAGAFLFLAILIYAYRRSPSGAATATSVFAEMASVWLLLVSLMSGSPLDKMLAAAAGVVFPLWALTVRRAGGDKPWPSPPVAVLSAVIMWGVFAYLRRDALFAGLAGGSALSALVCHLAQAIDRSASRRSERCRDV